MKIVFQSQDALEIYANVVSCCSGKSLREVLIHLAQEAGCTQLEAEQATDQICETVRNCCQLLDEVSGDTKAAFRKAFAELDRYPVPQQVRLLDDLLLSLEACSFPSPEERCRYLKEQPREVPEISKESAEQLKQKVMGRVEAMHLSPQMLKRVSKSLGKWENAVKAGVDAGLDDYNLKCIFSMLCYVKGRDSGMTAQQAVFGGCSSHEFVLVGTAVRQGLITQERASKILQAVTFALAVVTGVALGEMAATGAGAVVAIPLAFLMLGCFKDLAENTEGVSIIYGAEKAAKAAEPLNKGAKNSHGAFVPNPNSAPA